MATYDNDARIGEKSNAQDVDRTKRVAVVEHTVASTDAATDTIFLFTAPSGAKATGYNVSASSTVSGTTATLDIGTAADADGILDGGNIVSGAVVDDVVAPFDIGGVDVYATIATLTGTPTAGTVLTIRVDYDYST